MYISICPILSSRNRLLANYGSDVTLAE